jgi:hypothetical protein
MMNGKHSVREERDGASVDCLSRIFPAFASHVVSARFLRDSRAVSLVIVNQDRCLNQIGVNSPLIRSRGGPMLASESSPLR